MFQLIIFTPKSLLRLPAAKSALDDMSEGNADDLASQLINSDSRVAGVK
jgi:2-oxoglutarate dehydrogenase complex dehydrogenase (E1) component-like enzyme